MQDALDVVVAHQRLARLSFEFVLGRPEIGVGRVLAAVRQFQCASTAPGVVLFPKTFPLALLLLLG